MMPASRIPSILCLTLLVLCAPFAGACGRQEQEQRKAFIEFLETNVAGGDDRIRMGDATRTKVGNYGRHFDVLAAYSKELGDVNARLAGEKTRLAAPGPVSVDKLGSERARIEQLVAALSRSAQQVDAVKARADAARAALKQPEDLRAAFGKAFEKEISEYAAALKDLYAVQKDFYAEAARMGMFFEKHREKIRISNTTVTIDDQALVTEYNILQKAMQEKFRHMQAALTSGRSWAR